MNSTDNQNSQTMTVDDLIAAVESTHQTDIHEMLAEFQGWSPKSRRMMTVRVEYDDDERMETPWWVTVDGICIYGHEVIIRTLEPGLYEVRTFAADGCIAASIMLCMVEVREVDY